MRKNLGWLLLTTVFTLSLAMASVGTASSTPVIRVEPKNNTANVGETFTVSITVTGITEEESLYGWECRITFNPNIIKAVNATEGLFLKDTGYETFWIMEIDNTTGEVDMLAMFLFDAYPSTGAVGNGILAEITFKTVGQGTTALEFKEKKDTELHMDVIVGSVHTIGTITHTAEGGSFSNVGVLISPLLITGIAAAVCVVVVFYFRRKRTSQEPKEH